MASLSGAFSVSQADVPRLLKRIARFAVLPSEVRQAVAALPTESPSKDLLLSWTPQVDAAMSQLVVLQGPTTSFISRYSDGDLKALEFCSDQLHRYNPEQTLEESALATFSKKLSELRELLTDDLNFEAELRILLLRHVDAMERLIAEADLWGLLPVRRELATTLGQLLLSPQAVARAKDCSPKTWEKATAILATLAAAFSFGTAAIQAIEAASTQQPPAPIIVVETGSPGNSVPPVAASSSR